MKFFYFFFAIFLFSCQLYPARYTSETIEVNEVTPEDSTIIAFIEPYKAGLEDEMSREIGFFAHDMFKKKPEGELGNFMCDASQEYYNALFSSENLVDFTVMNYGGIRVQHIPQGVITVRNMFELMPFENELVTIEVPGSIVLQLFDRIAENRGWPVSENVNLLIDGGKVNMLLINGEPIDIDKTYTMLTTDYIANGGDGMDMFTELPIHKSNQKLRDVLIAFCEWKLDNNEMITAPINGRVIVTE